MSAQTETAPKPAPKEPRASSTIMLVRDGADGMEVFMVVRHHEIDFASGALVFPGGSLEPGDREIAERADLCEASVEPDARLRAIRIGAVRETFEECGVLLARPCGEKNLVGAAARDAFAAKIAGGATFQDALADQKLTLALDLLAPFAHWVTPAFMPKRFDTHFYVVAAPPDQIAVHDGSESVDSLWIDPRAALAGAESGKHTIIFPTRLNLAMLAHETSVQAALAAAKARKIVTVEPQPTQVDGRRALKIPLEAGYGGDVFIVDQPGVIPQMKAK